MFAIASLLAVVAVSLLVTRVATVILVASGMSSESARFQARSAFTGAGFTTNESEDIVSHPLRRRVVMTLMLLGNAGIVAAASGLIIGFRGGASGSEALKALALVVGLLAVVFVSRSSVVDRRLTVWIGHALHRWTELPEKDSGELLQLPDDRVVAELAVREGDWMAGRTLTELDLRGQGARVLGIQRCKGGYEDELTGRTSAVPGDVL
nr:TrkA C-terminal domain-containing protein [Solirubrobacterales bacterium]